MPNLHDIERRINSVSSTKQITRTMEMVAAAKIRRATERVTNTLPWAFALQNMLECTAPHSPLEAEPLLAIRTDVKRSLIIVVASDRGLAGGFNSGALRYAERMVRERERKDIEVEIIACGKKAISYFNYRNIKPVLEFRDLSADPTFEQATEISRYLSTAYGEGKLDEVLIVYNHAKNAAEQLLVEQQILPIAKKTYVELFGMNEREKTIFDPFIEKEEEEHPQDVDFEPDPESVMSYLMRNYLRNSVFYALLDSAAGEQGARRNAMKSATDNANEMVSTLTRIYNRARQGAITTEISEIVGGAAALEE